MTVEQDEPSVPAPAAVAAPPDCQHLDEDAEALEDPVHSGDARHQRDLHARQRGPAGG